MKVSELALGGVHEIVPDQHCDSRGHTSVIYSRAAFRAAGIAADWVQDNQSWSARAGVLRGMHFQVSPFAQDKLVRVARGAIFDVVVDVRKGSPQFGQWLALEVSAKARNQVFVPKGFAHGFLTLEDDTEVLYKVSGDYAPDHERAFRFDDPAIGVAWPLKGLQPLLSERDRAAPPLSEIDTGFALG
jgi:dTDP-4-dehydrorhamnose 3,5-epimerase